MNQESPATFDVLVSQLLNADVQLSQPLTTGRVLLAILVTFLLSLLILVTYRLCHRQVITRAGSSTALVLVSMVTTLVGLEIGGSSAAEGKKKGGGCSSAARFPPVSTGAGVTGPAPRGTAGGTRGVR